MEFQCPGKRPGDWPCTTRQTPTSTAFAEVTGRGWGTGHSVGLPRASRGPSIFRGPGAPGNGGLWGLLLGILIKLTVPTCASMCVRASYFNEKVALKYTGTSTLEDKLGRKGGDSATSGGF